MGEQGSIQCDRQYIALDNKEHSEKWLLFPSSLLWLLNLVQKELTSKGSLEIHNSKGSVYSIVNPEKERQEQH